MKKTYNIPEIKLSRFIGEDIVTTSVATTVANDLTSDNPILTLDGKTGTEVQNLLKITW